MAPGKFWRRAQGAESSLSRFRHPGPISKRERLTDVHDADGWDFQSHATPERAVLVQFLVGLAQIDRALASSAERDGWVTLHVLQAVPACEGGQRQFY